MHGAVLPGILAASIYGQPSECYQQGILDESPYSHGASIVLDTIIIAVLSLLL